MPRPRLVPHATLCTTPSQDTPLPWAIRHNRAVFAPQGAEVAIVALWRALTAAPDLPVSSRTAAAIRSSYARAYRAQYDGARVEDDCVLGPALSAALAVNGSPVDRFSAAADLLNGDIGRLDGGTLSGLLVAAAARGGVTL